MHSPRGYAHSNVEEDSGNQRYLLELGVAECCNKYFDQVESPDGVPYQMTNGYHPTCCRYSISKFSLKGCCAYPRQIRAVALQLVTYRRLDFDMMTGLGF